jgi:ubiquinone/menaquinone biosynthesis C-methylase UbiE
LDVWCGTGKYANLLAPYVKFITWIDASQDQIRLAQAKNRAQKNTKFHQEDAKNISLQEDSLDVILWCWFLPTIGNIKIQTSVIKKLQKILKPWGKILLIENDVSGEFELIREKNKLKVNPTLQYNNRLLSQWFSVAKKIKTYFLFDSAAQAKEVFTAIWWFKKGNNVHSKKIAHDVVIFERKKK